MSILLHYVMFIFNFVVHASFVWFTNINFGLIAPTQYWCRLTFVFFFISFADTALLNPSFKCIEYRQWSCNMVIVTRVSSIYFLLYLNNIEFQWNGFVWTVCVSGPDSLTAIELIQCIECSVSMIFDSIVSLCC